MRNIPTKITGSTLTADEFNDIPSELENTVTSSGQTLTSSDLTQVPKAIAQYSSVGDFYTDGGSADAYVLTPTGSLEAPIAYTSGMRVRFKPGNANTGASTVNVNSLGVKSVKTSDGTTDPVAADLDADRDTELVYDGTVFRIFSTGGTSSTAAASQAQMEAATAADVFATPARQQYHPGHPKAWASIDGTGTLTLMASYNVSSIADPGSAIVTVNWDVDFSSAEYCVQGTVQDINGGAPNPILFYLAQPSTNGQLAGSVVGACLDPLANAGADPERFFFSAFGDQA